MEGRSTRRRTLGWMPALVVAALVIARGLEAAASPGLEDALIVERAMAPGDVGYLLFDPRTGVALAEHQGARAFIPASVVKLATVTAALALLGPDHRFTTTLAATGTVADGVLTGDALLLGGGDPFLATEDLADLAQGLTNAGIVRVQGRFIADASSLPEWPDIDPAQPWTAGYNTGVSALSLNFNRFQLVWRRPSPTAPLQGEAWTVSDRRRLPLDGVTIEAGAPRHRDITTGERWRLEPPPGTPERMWLPLAHPADAAAGVFKRLARERGVDLPAPSTAPIPANPRPLAEHASPPLMAIARDLLRYSNNLSAELIGLATTRQFEGSPRTPAASGEALAAWIRGQRPDVDWSGFTLANHSGLGPGSAMSARQTAAILTLATTQLGEVALWTLLPEKEEGEALARVRAKSGTLAYARGLAGLFDTSSGRRLGFVIFIGDTARRQAFDATLDRSEANLPRDARAWLTRARALEGDLITLWRRR